MSSTRRRSPDPPGGKDLPGVVHDGHVVVMRGPVDPAVDRHLTSTPPTWADTWPQNPRDALTTALDGATPLQSSQAPPTGEGHPLAEEINVSRDHCCDHLTGGHHHRARPHKRARRTLEDHHQGRCSRRARDDHDTEGDYVGSCARIIATIRSRSLVFAANALGESRVASMPISFEPDGPDTIKVGGLNRDGDAPALTCEIPDSEPKSCLSIKFPTASISFVASAGAPALPKLHVNTALRSLTLSGVKTRRMLVSIRSPPTDVRPPGRLEATARVSSTSPGCSCTSTVLVPEPRTSPVTLSKIPITGLPLDAAPPDVVDG